MPVEAIEFDDLVAAGILGANDAEEFEDKAQFIEVLKTALQRGKQAQTQLQSYQSQKPKADDAEPGKEKAAPAQKSQQQPVAGAGDLETARSLQSAGMIGKKDGRWHSDNPAFAQYAEALNSRDLRIQGVQSRAAEMLAEAPDKFVGEFLGDPLEKLISERVNEATRSIQEKLDSYESRFVKAPTAFDLWYQEHEQELQKKDSSLTKAYNKAFHQIRQQMENRRGMNKLAPEDMEELVHQMAAERAEAEFARSSATQNGHTGEQPESESNNGQASSSQAKPNDDQSFVDRVNNGDPISETGTRNNGSARRLNDHAHAAGDESEIRTQQGRVDFMSLAESTAKESGINF